MAKHINPKAKKAKIFFLFLAIVLGAAAYWFSRDEQRERWSFSQPVVNLVRFEDTQPLMGTRFAVTVYAETPEQAQEAFAKAFARAEAINQVASDYLPDSEITRFNEHPAEQWFSCSEDFFAMVTYGLELAELTAGAYDPTLGTLTHLWRETRRAEKLPRPEVLALARNQAGWEHLQTNLAQRELRKMTTGLRLDLGGLAKGYAIDEMLQVFESLGLPHALVVAGGDVRCGLAPPEKKGWSVGLKNQDGEMVEVITVASCSISTSGDLQQFVEIDGERFSHIIDPSTGLGMTVPRMATVVAKTGLMSDPLATAACLNPDYFQKLSPATEIHSLILTEGEQQASAGFPSRLPLAAVPAVSPASGDGD